MQYLGITQFCVVTDHTLDAFRSTRGHSVDEAKEIVFDPRNLEEHLRYMEAFCMPTYRRLARGNPNAYGAVVINEDLPHRWKRQIIDMCASEDRVRAIQLADHQSVNSMVAPLARDIARGGRIYTYRHDDNDILPSDYLQNVKKIVEGVSDNTVISFNNGYSISRLGEDAFGLYVRKYPLNAFGLGIVSNASNLKTIFDLGAHTEIELPVHHDTNTIGWACTVHETNDSKIGSMNPKIISANEVMTEIGQRFPQISANELKVLTLRRASDYPS